MSGIALWIVSAGQRYKLLNRARLEFLFAGFARLFFILAFLAVFVPFMPFMPSSDIDSSWKFAMNQAIAQRLNIGTDVIFTFGPYASIYTMVYHPVTDHLMILGSCLISISYITLTIILAKPNKPLWLIYFSLLLSILYSIDDFSYARDAILFSYPVVLTLVIYRISIPISCNQRLEPSLSICTILLIAFFSLGILPLIKGTFLVIISSLLCLCALLLWSAGQKYMAITALVMPVVSLLVFWVYAGQDLARLPSYFVNLNQIISGYTNAMSSGGNWPELFVFGLAGSFTFCAIFAEKPFSMKSHIFLASIFAIFIFLGYKAGFVRNDVHILISAETLFFVGLFLSSILRNKLVVPVSLLIFVAGFVLSYSCNPQNYRSLYSRVPAIYKNAWDGVWLRLLDKNRLSTDFHSSLLAIRNELKLPLLSGTTDIYSYTQSYLLASKNSWVTRPIFQSYAAYNPTLLRLNESHLRGRDAPQNLLFRIETIDDRLPALDDGLSWPTIINYYCINGDIGPYIHFQRRVPVLHEALPLIQQETIYSATHHLGDTVGLPDLQVPLLAEITLAPNNFGKMFSAAYRMPYVRMTLTLTNGDQKDYRVIPSMMMTPFVLSPFIETTDDFRLLTENKDLHRLLAVESIEIYSIAPFTDFATEWSNLLWGSSYTLKLSRVHFYRENNTCQSTP